MKYTLAARVKRVVIDTISLTVEADSEGEACAKAEDALLVFPREHTVDGVLHCYVENREILDSDVLSIEPIAEFNFGR